MLSVETREGEFGNDVQLVITYEDEGGQVGDAVINLDHITGSAGIDDTITVLMPE